MRLQLPAGVFPGVSGAVRSPCEVLGADDTECILLYGNLFHQLLDVVADPAGGNAGAHNSLLKAVVTGSGGVAAAGGMRRKMRN